MDQGLNVPSVENLNRRSLCPCFPLQEQGPRSPVEEGAGIPTAAALREGSFFRCMREMQLRILDSELSIKNEGPGLVTGPLLFPICLLLAYL